MPKKSSYHFIETNRSALAKELGPKRLISILEKMETIRVFEERAEAAYLQGRIGGFFHSYQGQEAIQTACTEVFGVDHWFMTTYRCHALALLLGASKNEIMAEFFGRDSGNAQGRGGSMHLYTERLLGGFGIVGGQLPIAVGAALSSKYLKQNKVAICFLGDGAVAQGTFSESLNLASLWDLPCLYVIENNQWGMGTALERAVSVKPIAEKKAPAFNIESITIDANDYFNCHAGFTEAKKQIEKTGRPVLMEAVGERFRGHSISDPGLYRSKSDLERIKNHCSLAALKKELLEMKVLTKAQLENIQKEIKEEVLQSVKFAEESPWPNPATLGDGVMK